MVEGKFQTDKDSFVGPAIGSDIDASDIIFYVAFPGDKPGRKRGDEDDDDDDDDDEGGLGPAAVVIGKNSRVRANFYAPNGLLVLGRGTVAAGGFFARNVKVERGAKVTFESFYGNAPPVAVDDAVTTDEDTVLNGDVLAANPTTPDSDPDVDPLLVTQVNGVEANVGTQITLPSGALLTVNANGTFTYDPNGQFESLSVADTAIDSSTYTITDGNDEFDSASVTVTIDGTNDPPVLDPIGNQTIDEETQLAFTATATDVDAPDTLTFGLLGEPVGASITPGGVFTWTPTEAQGPGTFTFDVVVTDDGSPNLSDSETIDVTVADVNTPPVLSAIGNQSVDEQTLLTFTASATDADIPANNLTFSLSGAVPVGASITPGGVFTWTPNEAQGPGAFTIDVLVTDDGSPNLSDGETITITVSEVNEAPVLAPIGDQSVDEQTLLTFTASATDADIPANNLTFSLSGAVPVGASITPGGVFTWTPNEAQGPGAFTIDVLVTDDGSPNLSDGETITITVSEVNEAPVLAPIGDQSVDELTLLTFTAGATDADSPANNLTFSLSGAVPVGASITSGGVFTWTPTGAQGPGTFTFDVVVTDDGSPNLPDSETIDVTVNEVVNLPPTAVNHTFDAIGNVGINVLAVNRLLSGASDPDIPANTLSVNTFDSTTTGLGTVTVDAGTGSFSYSPAPGFTGLDTFTYTLIDDGVPNLTSNTATVTINVTNLIWFIDNTAAAGGDGRLTTPFNSLAAFTASAPDGPGDIIFIDEGNGTSVNYNTGITLLNNQQLIGQGVDLAAATGITLPPESLPLPGAAGNPTLTNPSGDGITLGSGNTIRGLTVGDTPNGAGITGTSVGSATVSDVTINGSGVAVDINGGTLDMTFDSVSANGGANGIVLENTNGSFTVTGTGAAGSGGTIQNMTGANGSTAGLGIRLNQAQNVSLTSMQLNDFSNFAIRGTNVTNFTLTNTVINGSNGNSAPADEGSVSFDNLLGTATFTNNTISGGLEDNIVVTNNTGTLNMTVTGGTIGLNSTLLGNDGILVESRSAAVVDLTVSGVTFLGARGDLVQANALSTSVMDVTIRDNTFQNAHTNSSGGGITISGGAAGSNITLTYDISGTTPGAQTFRDAVSSAITANIVNGAGTVTGTIRNNRIGVLGQAGSGSSGGGAGITVGTNASVTHTVMIDNNTIRQVNGTNAGIDVFANGASVLNATITNNTVAQLEGFTLAALYTLSGGATLTDTASMCLDARTNTFDASASFGFDIFVDQISSSASYRLPGYVGGPNDAGAIQSFLAGQNTVNPSAVDAFSAKNVTGTGTSCP